MKATPYRQDNIIDIILEIDIHNTDGPGMNLDRPQQDDIMFPLNVIYQQWTESGLAKLSICLAVYAAMDLIIQRYEPKSRTFDS